LGRKSGSSPEISVPDIQRPSRVDECITQSAAGYIPLLEGNSIAKLLAGTIFLEVVMEEATKLYGSAESIC
jgi:hypothetical protein